MFNAGLKIAKEEVAHGQCKNKQTIQKQQIKKKSKEKTIVKR